VNEPGTDLPDQRTATERWRSIPRRWRAVLLAIAALVVGELGWSVVGGIVGSAPAGSGQSSAFGTSSSGVAALTQLFAAHGHSVERSTRPVSESGLPADCTLFVVDPVGWTDADTVAVHRFVEAGGHFVLAGPPPSHALLMAMFGARTLPRWQPTPSETAHPVGSSPVVAGITQVSGGNTGSIALTGSAVAVLAGAHSVFAVSSPGPISEAPASVFLASSTPLTNASLADQDNAALALNLAGPASRSVVFDEYDHGYGHTGGGLAGLPVWWRWGLVLALGAVVVWMLSAARRFGPVEAADRTLIPPRVAYADAMATILASLPDKQHAGSVRPLQEEARVLLYRRAGVSTTTEPADVTAAARAANVPDQVLLAVFEEPGSDADLIALGNALAWLETHTGGRT
jgi:hypothetical protein